VPSYGNQPYSTRVVDQNGKPLKDWYGEDIGLVTPLGTGNPADDGVSYGTGVTVVRADKLNQTAIIRVTPPRP
jgi:immune inhibitor A